MSLRVAWNRALRLTAYVSVVWLSTTLTSAQSVQINPDRVTDVQQIRHVTRLEAIPGHRDYSGRIMVRPKAGVVEQIATDLIEPQLIDYKVSIDSYVVQVPDGASDRAYAAALEATELYELVEPDWKVYLAATPNDPNLSFQWQHAMLQSALAWDVTTGDPNIIIAVIDTGVDYDHPDLAAALVPGRFKNFDVGTLIETFPGEHTNDTHGHGTHVAGCAAAIGNNGTGGSGMGWDFSIMPIKVTDNTEAYLSDVADSVTWAAQNGAKVINVSFTGGDTLSAAIAGTSAWSNGALLFWAAGNNNQELLGWNSSAYVIVAATTAADKRWTESNFGHPVDIGAPGAGIHSTWLSGGYNTISGTSMAAPIAAGCGAMVMAANPLLTPDEVQDILFSTADDIGETEFNLGHGRINLFNAVTAALIYDTDEMLTVTASHQMAEAITVVPQDLNGDSDGVTMFQRLYPRLSDVTLTAPAMSDGRHFDRWDLNGAQQTIDQTYVVSMNRSYTATAVYANKLRIESDPPGVRVNLLPNDLDNQIFGITPFDASYYENSGNVQLTAFGHDKGLDFIEWRIDGVFASSSPVMIVSTEVDQIITAVYGTITLGDLDCSGSIDASDISPFIKAFLDPTDYAEVFPNCNRMLADMNQDGQVDASDISPFVRVLIQQ